MDKIIVKADDEEASYNLLRTIYKSIDQLPFILQSDDSKEITKFHWSFFEALDKLRLSSASKCDISCSSTQLQELANTFIKDCL